MHISELDPKTPLAMLAELTEHRETLIANEGLAAFTNKVGEQLAALFEPSTDYVALTGNFFFRHDGTGSFELKHCCAACEYVIGTDCQVAETLDLFQYALDRDWLSYLLEACERREELATVH